MAKHLKTKKNGPWTNISIEEGPAPISASMKAAKKIQKMMTGTANDQQIGLIARIISEESGLKELIDAAEVVCTNAVISELMEILDKDSNLSKAMYGLLAALSRAKGD